MNLGFSCHMLFVSDQMPFLYKIEADWKCTKEDLIDRRLPLRVPTAPLETVEGPWHGKSNGCGQYILYSNPSCAMAWPHISDMDKSDRYGRYIFYLNPCYANISILLPLASYFFGLSMSATFSCICVSRFNLTLVRHPRTSASERHPVYAAQYLLLIPRVALHMMMCHYQLFSEFEHFSQSTEIFFLIGADWCWLMLSHPEANADVDANLC